MDDARAHPARVVVAGAGITGLVAARELERGGAQEVIVLEAAAEPGGLIRTLELDGAKVEAGPDWFPVNRPEGVDLCRDLGLEDELVAPATSGALIWARGRLTPMPVGFVRGVPTSPVQLLRCGRLSPAARLRGLVDLVLAGPLTGPDISVGKLVRRRFGRQVLDRLVDPMLAASRSGDPDELSLAAAAAELDAAARSSRSVMRALEGGNAPVPPFAGLAGGMKVLIDRLLSSLDRPVVHYRASVEAVRRNADGFEVATSRGERITADGVVLALPAHAVARVLMPLDRGLATDIGSIRHAPAVVTSFLYPPQAVPGWVRGASGWLVPRSERRLMTACAWFSRKWAHARPATGGSIMRCFAGRAENDPALALDEDELRTRLSAEIAEATGATAEPIDAVVTRWERALPILEVGHLDRMARIDAGVERHHGLAVAGAGFHGSGLVDCIAQANAAARRVLGRAR